MKLTRKCKEDFEKWFIENPEFWKSRRVQADLIDWFNDLDESMQYGVYVDFFDSIGIYISDMVDCYHSSRNKPQFSTSGFSMCVEGNGFCKDIDDLNTRQEAREQAILKANEIYNL